MDLDSAALFSQHPLTKCTFPPPGIKYYSFLNIKYCFGIKYKEMKMVLEIKQHKQFYFSAIGFVVVFINSR